MVEPIHSVEKFMETFKIGDTFFSLESFDGEPIGISEPQTIYG